MAFASVWSVCQTTAHQKHSHSLRFALGGTATDGRGRRKLQQRVASILGGGGGYDDPGSWDVSPEWWGTQGGGWGRNEGSTIFEKESLHGNGLVTVTAHPAEGKSSQLQTGVSEWRVLRFNTVTRQSVNRVSLMPGSNESSLDPECLAFEYLKTMAVAGWLLLERARSSEVELCFVGGGGFTLPSFFSNIYENSHVQSVEIDPVVVEAATSHMGIDAKNTNIIEGDAVDFLPGCIAAGDTFDCVFIDAFDGKDAIPCGLSDPDGPFLPALAQALHPENGAVIINVHGGRISSSLNVFALFKSDPGFDETSEAGKSVKKIIDAFSSAVLGGSASKGCCFTLSTAHQDNVIVVLSRGLPQGSDPKALKELFKVGCVFVLGPNCGTVCGGSEALHIAGLVKNQILSPQKIVAKGATSLTECTMTNAFPPTCSVQDIAKKDGSRLPFNPQPRFERDLCVW